MRHVRTQKNMNIKNFKPTARHHTAIYIYSKDGS